MRQHHQIVAIEQHRRDAWFTVEDIQRGAADTVEHQRLRQRMLVHHLATRGVDQECIGLHQVQPAAVDQVPVGRATRAVQRNEVALRQHRVERLDLGGAIAIQNILRHRRAVLHQDFHAEPVMGTLGHGLTDAAETDDAQHLARDLGAHQMGRAPAGPLAGAQLALALARAARHHQHQRHGDIGGAFRQHVGGVGHGDAMGAHRVGVDMAVPHAVIGQQPGLRRGHIQRLGPQLVGDRGQDRIEPGQGRAELGTGQRGIGAVELCVEPFGQLRLDGGGPAAGDQNAGLAVHDNRHVHHAASLMTLAMVSPITAGLGATVTPAAVRISTFSEALSPNAEMIAPAWPMVRPLGAVRPAT